MYSNACSRCATNRHECKTDASFKRIPARSRIKDLESQINQLKRDRAFSQATSTKFSVESTPEAERCNSDNIRGNDNLAVYPVSEGPSLGSATNSDLSRRETRWLNLIEFDGPSHFSLGGTTLPYAHALELFQHFEDHYYSHFCILEPITSLKQLHADSEFLFWSIISIAARNHQRYAPLFDSVRQLLERLRAAIIMDSVPSFLNLQALLLLCAFPFHTSCPLYRDPSWTQLGLAINAARQMGLNKNKDEPLFGNRRAQDSINRHPRHIRHMTWMKCFQLDVEMSCWHGHVPSLASTQAPRTMSGLCDAVPPSKFAAQLSVDIELAQALTSIDDAAQPSSHVIRMCIDRLDTVKTNWSHVWSLDAELELLMAKLYMYAARLASPESSIQGNDDSYSDTLQASHATAVQLATLVTNLSAEAQANAPTYGFTPDHSPLPGHPKHHSQTAFFAAIVLFKYLDNDHAATEDDRESARNAFSKIFQMFSSFSSTSDGSESHNAALTLQVIGRAIGHGSGNLEPHVTTRMGASLMHNAVWLASQIQAGESQHSGEDIFGATSTRPPDVHIMVPPEPQSYSGSHVGYDTSYITTTAPFEDIVFTGPSWGSATVSLPNIEFGYSAWDNSVFDCWQGDLPYPPVTTLV